MIDSSIPLRCFHIPFIATWHQAAFDGKNRKLTAALVLYYVPLRVRVSWEYLVHKRATKTTPSTFGLNRDKVVVLTKVRSRRRFCRLFGPIPRLARGIFTGLALENCKPMQYLFLNKNGNRVSNKQTSEKSTTIGAPYTKGSC